MLDSWQKRERTYQKLNYSYYSHYSQVLKDIRSTVTQTVTHLTSIYSIYIFFVQRTLSYSTLLSSFLVNDALSGRTLAYPKKVNLWGGVPSRIVEVLEKTFFQKT